jgi:hypothetical protein
MSGLILGTIVLLSCVFIYMLSNIIIAGSEDSDTSELTCPLRAVQVCLCHVSGAVYLIPIIKYDGGILVQADFPGMDHLTIGAGNLRLFSGPVGRLNDLLSLQGGLLRI